MASPAPNIPPILLNLSGTMVPFLESQPNCDTGGVYLKHSGVLMLPMHTLWNYPATAGCKGFLIPRSRRQTVIESRVLVRAVVASGGGHRADRKVPEKPQPSYFLLHPSPILLGIYISSLLLGILNPKKKPCLPGYNVFTEPGTWMPCAIALRCTNIHKV